jgi:hypothetical protein
LIWLAVFAAIGVALVLLYRDADQQDSGAHFLLARWAHRHPQYFVSVWARPLFTLLYFPPAQLGYWAAKLFTVIISLATAWQTFRLARQVEFDRAELAIPLLFLQPSFFLICSTVMTETLFALLFVVALRLHLSGRINSGMLVASLLVLARPEGFFICALWGLWVLLGAFRLKMALQTSLLASGLSLWWAAAYLITGDPLWIIHDWPSNWWEDNAVYGTGPIWWYIISLPLIVGPLLLPPFAVGLWRLLKKRQFITGVSAFLTLFAAHSFLFWRGGFGSAGYARYFVCVSPAIALITLAGWNDLAEASAKLFKPARTSIAALALALSALVGVFYVDSRIFSRDARAVEEMYEWFRAHPRPVSRLICSQAYMQILFDRDESDRPAFTADREYNLALIRQSPGQTLVFWDQDTGPKWYGLRAEDFEAAGYIRLKSQGFNLEGRFIRRQWKNIGRVRTQQMHLLYKE